MFKNFNEQMVSDTQTFYYCSSSTGHVWTSLNLKVIPFSEQVRLTQAPHRVLVEWGLRNIFGHEIGNAGYTYPPRMIRK